MDKTHEPKLIIDVFSQLKAHVLRVPSYVQIISDMDVRVSISLTESPHQVHRSNGSRLSALALGASSGVAAGVAREMQRHTATVGMSPTALRQFGGRARVTCTATGASFRFVPCAVRDLQSAMCFFFARRLVTCR